MEVAGVKVEKKHMTFAGVGGLLTVLTLVVNWAIDTDKKIGESHNQRMALIQADSALFHRDSLQGLDIKQLQRATGVKGRRRGYVAPPPSPKREGLLKKLAGLFW